MYTKLIIDIIMAGFTMEVQNKTKIVNDEIYIWLGDKQIKISAKKF